MFVKLASGEAKYRTLLSHTMPPAVFVTTSRYNAISWALYQHSAMQSVSDAMLCYNQVYFAISSPREY